MRNRTIIPALAGLLLVAAAAMAQTTTTSTYTTTIGLPVVGLAPSETMQINVLNAAAVSANATAASCTGSVTFYNSAGTAIGSPSTFTVGSGQISSVKLPYASAGGSGSRTVLRPVITTMGTIPAKAPCALEYSLETYDTAMGITHVFIGNAASVTPLLPVLTTGR